MEVSEGSNRTCQCTIQSAKAVTMATCLLLRGLRDCAAMLVVDTASASKPPPYPGADNTIQKFSEAMAAVARPIALWLFHHSGLQKRKPPALSAGDAK